MQAYYETIIDASGNGVNGASITVYKRDNITLAAIYSDDGITSKSNPIISDSLGRFYFYASNGRYSLKISGPGIVTYWVYGLCLYDSTMADNPVLPCTLYNGAMTANGQTPSYVRCGDIVSIFGQIKNCTRDSIIFGIPNIHVPVAPFNTLIPVLNASAYTSLYVYNISDYLGTLNFQITAPSAIYYGDVIVLGITLICKPL